MSTAHFVFACVGRGFFMAALADDVILWEDMCSDLLGVSREDIVQLTGSCNVRSTFDVSFNQLQGSIPTSFTITQ